MYNVQELVFYATFYAFYTLIFFAVIPPIAVSIFGYLSYRNVAEGKKYLLMKNKMSQCTFCQ